MRFFNIDKGLELPQKFNIMHDALDELYAKRQEEFQKSNPLKEIYKMFPLTQFQKSFGSSTGFKQAFEQTTDYASYPGFTNGDGFKTTISYKAFNGKIVFTWQLILEDNSAAASRKPFPSTKSRGNANSSNTASSPSPVSSAAKSTTRSPRPT